jgi:hypothetical protein
MTERNIESPEPERSQVLAAIGRVLRFILWLVTPQGLAGLWFPEKYAKDLGDGGVQKLFGPKSDAISNQRIRQSRENPR